MLLQGHYIPIKGGRVFKRKPIFSWKMIMSFCLSHGHFYCGYLFTNRMDHWRLLEVSPFSLILKHVMKSFCHVAFLRSPLITLLLGCFAMFCKRLSLILLCLIVKIIVLHGWKCGHMGFLAAFFPIF